MPSMYFTLEMVIFGEKRKKLSSCCSDLEILAQLNTASNGTSGSSDNKKEKKKICILTL